MEVSLAPDVVLRRLADGLWLHVTLGTDGYRGYPANGLLLETARDGAILFDTGWDGRADGGHRALGRRAWPSRPAGRHHARARRSRMGGIRALRARGITVSSLALTATRARSERLLPDGLIATDTIAGLADRPLTEAAGFELFHPGAGHAPDNIVVYFPRQRVLFGGCLLRPDTATTVGNVADADVGHWPHTVAAVRATYPLARVVVPGHGAIGDRRVLTATERLVREKGVTAKRALGR